MAKDKVDTHLAKNDQTDFAERVRLNQQKLTAELKPYYDFIVCGSRSSGSVVALRLAKNPEVSVFLLEAAIDVPLLQKARSYESSGRTSVDSGCSVCPVILPLLRFASLPDALIDQVERNKCPDSQRASPSPMRRIRSILEAGIRFIGNLMPRGHVKTPMPVWWDSLDQSKPVVLVTQGTIANRDFS
jgi:hypothetical protein